MDCSLARVLDADGNGTASHPGVEYRLECDHGADVINLSLAGPDGRPCGEVRRTKEAVNKARASGAGHSWLAAGNEGFQEGSTDRRPSTPRPFQKVIAVSATNENDRLATSPAAVAGWTSRPGNGHPVHRRQSEEGTTRDGTSESAPFVSALAGLLALRLRRQDGVGIQQRMQSTATDLGAAGDDPKFGHGRINANRAVLQINITTPTIPLSLSFSPQ